MDEDGEVIHLDQPWNQEFVYPISGGGIQAQLVDMQSCFNLNALKEPDATKLTERKKAFEWLLQQVEPEIPSYNRELVKNSLADWLDEDDIPQGIGAEDSEYESRQFPYITANNYMVHKSELRLINGVEVSWLRELLKLVCVLPNDSLFEINVNTVSEENAAVLAAATKLTLADAKSILTSRDSEGFQDVNAFLTLPSIQALDLSADQKKWFTVKTSHFILHTKTKYNDATFAMQTLFKVDSSNNVSIIRRDFSGF
jgi:general secretion pathway protein K